jgi:hypothetical protein
LHPSSVGTPQRGVGKRWSWPNHGINHCAISVIDLLWLLCFVETPLQPLGIIVLTPNQVFVALSSSFTGSPIHPPLGALTHNNLKESCEILVKSQNSPLVHEVVVVTKDVGITYDLFDSSTNDSQPTNFICDKCKVSLENDDISCDKSNIIVENEILIERVNALTHDLEKAYGGKAKLYFILGSQHCSLNREGLGYLHKKGKIHLLSKRPCL